MCGVNVYLYLSKMSLSLEEEKDRSVVTIATLNVGRGLRTHGKVNTAAAVARWCTQHGVDVMGVSEYGQPPPDVVDALADVGYSVIAAERREGGTALFVKKDISARLIVKTECDGSGRAVAVVVADPHTDTRTLIACLYLPTGLEAKSLDSEQVQEAKYLYSTVRQWQIVHKCERAIVMGDMNETLSDADRCQRNEVTGKIIPRDPATRRSHAPILDILVDKELGAGFVDCYRSIHKSDGFTCFTSLPNDLTSLSRIDYILSLGWSTPLTASVEKQIEGLKSNHRPVIVKLSNHHHRSLTEHTFPRMVAYNNGVPNMRAALPHHIAAMCAEMERLLGDGRAHKQTFLQTQSTCRERAVAAVEDTVTWLVKCAQTAMLKLPTNRSAVRKHSELSAHISAVCARARAAHNLLMKNVGREMSWKNQKLIRDLFSSMKAIQRSWKRVNRDSVHMITVKLESLCDHGRNILDSPLAVCVEWVDRCVRCLRLMEGCNAERMAVEKKERKKRENADASGQRMTAAAVHKLLRGNRPSALLSVVNPTTQRLEVGAEEVKHVLHTHFKNITSESPASASPPLWWRDVCDERAEIKSEWYAPLMAPVEEVELRTVAASCKVVSAGGLDRVGGGVWRALVMQSPVARAAILQLFNACIRLAYMPLAGRRSVIVPLRKKENGGNDLSNIRPIALQATLTKLLSKVLARRLQVIFARYPILHPSQHGFMRGKSTHECVTALADTLEFSLSVGSPSIHVFYDIKGAYDSVRHVDVIRALQRLKLPETYIEWVRSSLSDLEACVRTAFGYTDFFPVQRSVPQGGCESPLWFLAVMDTWLTVMHSPRLLRAVFAHTHTLSVEEKRRLQLVNKREGSTRWERKVTCLVRERASNRTTKKKQVQSARVISKAFADDVWVTAPQITFLSIIHKWAREFSQQTQLIFNPTKTVLGGLKGSDTKKCGRMKRVFTRKELSLEFEREQKVKPVSGNTTIRYLGAVVTLTKATQCKEAVENVTKRLLLLCARILPVYVCPANAVWILNRFVMPSLEYALHTATPTKREAQRWDQIVVNALLLCCRVHGWKVKRQTLALVTGLILPSHLEKTIKISEMFNRVNTCEPSEDRKAARVMWLEKSEERMSERMVRVRNSLSEMKWTITHKRNTKSTSTFPKYTVKNTRSVRLCLDGEEMEWEIEVGKEWIDEKSARTVEIFTDGSASSEEKERGTAWAFLIADQWLKEQWEARTPVVTAPEDEMSALLLRGAPLFAGYIDEKHSGGVFEAELRAILEALLSVPFTWSLVINSDSQAAIAAVTKYESAVLTPRTRLRSAARPLLRLIHHAIGARRAHAATVTFKHVRAHTNNIEWESVGNKCVDFAARSARVSKRSSDPQLKLTEEWMTVYKEDGISVVASDMRRAVMDRLREMSYEEWRSEESSQHTYARAVEGARELWRHVAGTEQRPAPRIPADNPGVAFVIRLVSDTLQFHETEQRGDVWKCNYSVCGGCVCDVYHLFHCAHPQLAVERAETLKKLTEELQSLGVEHKHTSVLEWCRQLQGTSVVDESVTRAAAFGAFTNASMRVLLKRCGVGVDSGVQSEHKSGRVVMAARINGGKRVVRETHAARAPPTLPKHSLPKCGGVGVCSGVDSEVKRGGERVGEERKDDLAVAKAISRLRDLFLTSMWRLWRVSLSAHARVNVKPAAAVRGGVRATAAVNKSRVRVEKKR